MSDRNGSVTRDRSPKPQGGNLPEGHTLHRLALDLTEAFAGRVVSVSSPQGRFAESAALLDKTRMIEATAHGKHLFCEFDRDRCAAHPSRLDR